MRPLPPPSLEVITDRPDRRLVVLMSTPEAVVTQARYGPGQPGASPHVHRRHADLFHVVEGGLEFLLGPNHSRHRLGPGQTVIAPPGVVHGFDLPASEAGWFLNVHAPGVEFDVYLRIVKITRASMAYACAVSRGGEPIATGALTIVCVTRGEDGRMVSAPFPADVRSRFDVAAEAGA